MGWSGGGEIVAPQITFMVGAIQKGAITEAMAEALLTLLIDTCQDNDWDTESATLEQYSFLPWVVRAFLTCDVRLGNGGELPSREMIKAAVLNELETRASVILSLNSRAETITNAVMALLPSEEDE